jgi:hypothetical protein
MVGRVNTVEVWSKEAIQAAEDRPKSYWLADVLAGKFRGSFDEWRAWKESHCPECGQELPA